MLILILFFRIIPILSVVLAGVLFIDLIDKLEVMNKSVKL